MNLYPWLDMHYYNIIYHLKNKKNNRAIILNTYKGIGTTSLIKKIGIWLLCINHMSNGCFCNQCRNCQLVSSKHHPDWYNMKLFSHNNIIGVDTVRWLCNEIFKTPKISKNKVIYFPDASQLTEHGTNALLKTLEEPPKNTYFLLINYFSYPLLPTLRSRCTLYKISIPSENVSINWLKNNHPEIKEHIFKTALRVNKGSPIYAKKFIFTQLWKTRNTFFHDLTYSIKNDNLFYILDNLNLGDIKEKIFWLCSLLFDSMKAKYNDMNHIINLDKIDIIRCFEEKYSFFSLDNSLRSWIHFNFKLINISGINKELLLTEQLLRWESILKLYKY
ncbi:MAG: DNA polymerase III subunit delta' C-terminal domain-containing protein [Buchnera aphidicola (Meitanaphis flavogallis)]